LKVEVAFMSMDFFPCDGPLLVSLPDNATAGALLHSLDEKEGRKQNCRLETDGYWNVLVVVNGCAIGPEYVLRDGDKVKLFPSMTGG
jgi:molybdopterin converting factor small subunit